jgi:hypothetical protein
MKRTISTYLTFAAMAVVVAGSWAMADTARAQECASCGGGGGSAPVIEGGAPCGTCGTCDTCGSCGGCATCPSCGHPLLAIPLAPIRFVFNTLGDMFRCTGCGCETYYGDDWCGCGHGCCEPCDACGNYVGGCGRCGTGGLRGLLFGDASGRGAAVSDETVSGGMMTGNDMVVGNHPSYNVAHNSGTCPTCGRSYANAASAPRSNAVSTASAANRGYPANANANATVRYNRGYNAATANYAPARANYAASATRSPSPQVDLSNLPPGRFSPKVISVTDEVVSPADAQAARPIGTTTR